MAHRDRRCVKSPACDVAMAGGKRMKNMKHALLVAAFAKANGLAVEDAAAIVSKGVDALLGGKATSLGELAAAIGVTAETAASLLDALEAFEYVSAR